MRRAKLPYIRRALRRTYPAGLPARVTARTRVRLRLGSTVTLAQFCRLYWYFDAPYTKGKSRLSPSRTRAAERAATYPGIAAAMADQWGK